MRIIKIYFVSALIYLAAFSANAFLLASPNNEMLGQGIEGNMTKGLVAYYSGAKNSLKSALVLADLTPNGYNLTSANTPTFGTDRKNAANQAITCNGATDQFTGVAPNLNAYSLSAWFNSTIGSNLGAVSELSNASSQRRGVQVAQAAGLNIFYGANLYRVAKIGTDYRDSVWHHIAITYAGSGIPIVYVDNVLATLGNEGAAGVPTGASIMKICNSTISLARFLTGSVADVRWYSNVLSATEITRLYQSYNPNLFLNTQNKNLIGWWSLASKDLKSSTVIADLTPNG